MRYVAGDLQYHCALTVEGLCGAITGQLHGLLQRLLPRLEPLNGLYDSFSIVLSKGIQ